VGQKSKPHIFVRNFTKCSTEYASENENRSVFGKDMGKNVWLTFWPTLYIVSVVGFGGDGV